MFPLDKVKIEKTDSVKNHKAAVFIKKREANGLKLPLAHF